MVNYNLLLSDNVDDLKIAAAMLDGGSVDELFEYHWIINCRYAEFQYSDLPYKHDIEEYLGCIFRSLDERTYQFDYALWEIAKECVRYSFSV